jgi:hypothetical protein
MAERDNNYPIISERDGIKLKTEKMVIDQLYHCIYQKKVFLFFKDEENMLHCYEIENPDAVREIMEKPSDLDAVLRKYAHSHEG